MADGANSIVIGTLGCNIPGPVAVVGGNCSIMALDTIGEELMWTVNSFIIVSKIWSNFHFSDHLFKGDR